jgi:BirA family biotin operon repressor/biotin-[acetyl-CoA-carboxylase] ligase
MDDLIHSSEVNSGLEGTMFAGNVRLFSTVDSTNTLAMQEAQIGAPHGSVYVAEEQTAGRGRGAHDWHSEPCAGLYISVILRPEMAPADALWLSLATGLAVKAATENVTALVADIRWPNDLMFGSRKFGGILTEMNAEGTRVRYAVVGIGINVNHGQFPAELRELATSLNIELGRAVPRQDLLVGILQTLHEEVQALTRPGNFARATDKILKRIDQNSSWIRGKRVTVNEAGGYTGVTAGLDARGFLRVETDTGLRTVLSGGVRAAKG